MKKHNPGKLFCLLSALLITGVCAFAQTPVQEWSRSFDGLGNGFDQITFIRFDAQNNVVVTGTVWGGNNTELDVVTRKYDPSGNVLWTHTWNNAAYSLEDIPNDLGVAPNGTVIVAGMSRTESGNYINSNGFVYAIDASGNFLWEDSIKGSGYTPSGGNYIGRNYVSELAISSNNEIFLGGTVTGSDGNNQYERTMVAKYNTSGQQQWISYNDNSTDWDYTDFSRALGIDAQGNSYVCGTTTLATTWRDVATWQITAAGNFGWIGTEPGPDNNSSEQAEGILVDDAGNSYTFGFNSLLQVVVKKYNAAGVEQWTDVMDTVGVGFSGAYTGADKYLVFDNAGNIILAAPMNGKIGVAKYSPSGTLLWLKFYSGTGPGNNEVYRVVTDAANNIYFSGAVPNTGSSYFDLIVIKTDSDGNELWRINHAAGDGFNDKGHSLLIQNNGAIYVGGFSSSDYFLAKYMQSPISAVEHETINALNIFPNPASGSISIQCGMSNGTYMLRDITGKTLLEGNVYSEKFTLNINALSSGVYFVSVTNGERQANGKIIKE